MLFKILLGLKEEGIRNEQDLAEYDREFVTNDIIEKWQITRVDEIKFKKLEKHTNNVDPGNVTTN
jgi:hypothetical protein